MALYNCGIKMFSFFGLNMSPKFISRLSALNLQNIYISYNNDSESERNRGFEGAVKSIFKLSDAVDFDRIYFCPPDSNDFGDMTKEQIYIL